VHGRLFADGVIAYNDEMVLGALQAIEAAGRNELVGWIWGKDGTRTGLEALLANQMTFTVQTPPYFGDLTIEVFQKYLNGESFELVQYVNKEVFDNDLLAQRERVAERIGELEEMGVGCC
jgi:ribose transport system substrate-binding protein